MTEEQGWEDQAREQIVIEGIRRQCALVPGLVLKTDVKCRVTRPEPPDVPNIHMIDCHFLVNHSGDHSWGAWPRGYR